MTSPAIIFQEFDGNVWRDVRSDDPVCATLLNDRYAMDVMLEGGMVDTLPTVDGMKGRRFCIANTSAAPCTLCGLRREGGAARKSCHRRSQGCAWSVLR